MRPTAAAVLTCCLSGLLLGGGRPRESAPGAASEVPGPLQEAWSQGSALFTQGRYQEAAAVFEAGARKARALGHLRSQARFLNNVASSRLACFLYRDAIRAYLEARELAVRRGDWGAAATVSSNLATAYAQMGELATAHAAAEHALQLARRVSPADPQLLLRAATLRARQSEPEGALPLFDQAARLADQNADGRTLAQVWRTLGYEYLRRGDLLSAEPILLEAFRLDRLSGAPDICLSFRNLALLRSALGDGTSAERLMDAALEHARGTAGRAPLWSLYYERGRLRRRHGRLWQALADLRHAADLARRWRVEALPAEAFAISVDAGLHQLYGALTETAAELAWRTGRSLLAQEAFEAAEENRAASLRVRLERGVDQPPSFSPLYGQLLRELHLLEQKREQHGPARVHGRLEEVRRRLVELEIEAGLQSKDQASFRWDKSGPSLARLQQTLAADEAYLGFYLGEPTGYRWSVTRRSFRMDRLAPRSQIRLCLDSFLTAVQNGSPMMDQEGRRLYGLLFGGLSKEVDNKRKWLLALDVELFALATAALPLPVEAPRSVYLIERHAVQVVPGAKSLPGAAQAQWEGPFLAVADPVYNRADARWNSSSGKGRSGFEWRLFPRLSATAEDAFELPRLPGSSREARACAALWRGRGSQLLEGVQATPAHLATALRSGPDVLHVAAHVLPARENPDQASIVLSLGSDGKPQWLGPATIRTLRPASKLVVLSGCHSARGPVLPGAGLLGLTRAWLTAGSRAVVASLWPTSDDSGELFVRFYQHLQALPDGGARAAALALQRAQLDMLASGDWRARPGYWAAYVVIGVL